MFFHYRQNNTGGSFHIDEAAGITVNVIIEADSAEDADRRFEIVGGYFDGCKDGRDCGCCGDRWSRAWDDDGDDVPCLYGTPLDRATLTFPWTYGKEVVVHYKDGSIVWPAIQEDQ